MTDNQAKLFRALKRLQSRFASVAKKSLLERMAKQGRKPKLVHKIDSVSLRVYPEKNHWLPHFHIQFKNKEFSASYEIETGRKLAGRLPAKYEDAMLEWALKNKALLHKEWAALKAGGSTQLTVEGS